MSTTHKKKVWKMSNRFYLACFRDNVGSNVSFQCKDFKGYSTDVAKAHVCTLDQAEKFYSTAREFDQPICADSVDALTVWKVDSQNLPTQSNYESVDGVYVAYLKGSWDGNDVYWLNHHACTVSTDFMTASKLTRNDAMRLADKYNVLPHEFVTDKKRRTFAFKLFDQKLMVKKAGLVKPEHLKKKRKATTAKTRFNCPTCGKIHWQYEPHIFVGCIDKNCNQYGVCT